MSKREKNEQDLPTLEISPSEEYHDRPQWQRIGAFVLIALVVAATAACAFWTYLQ